MAHQSRQEIRFRPFDAWRMIPGSGEVKGNSMRTMTITGDLLNSLLSDVRNDKSHIWSISVSDDEGGKLKVNTASWSAPAGSVIFHEE